MRHLLNVIGSILRERRKRKERSPQWRAVEKAHLAKQPECAACPGRRQLQVHHIKPFHEHPELELDPRNLITLCMGSPECHLRVGHLGNWKSSNPDVVATAVVLKSRRAHED